MKYEDRLKNVPTKFLEELQKELVELETLANSAFFGVDINQSAICRNEETNRQCTLQQEWNNNRNSILMKLERVGLIESLGESEMLEDVEYELHRRTSPKV